MLATLGAQAQTDHGVDQLTTEKAHRWLGFVQSQLWSEGFYTIEEMMEHNL